MGEENIKRETLADVTRLIGSSVSIKSYTTSSFPRLPSSFWWLQTHLPPPSPQQTGSILAHCVTSRRPDGYTQAQFIQPNDKSDGIRKKSQKKNEENFLLLKCERCRLFSLFAFRIFYDLLRTTPCRCKINDAKGGKDSSTLEKKKKKYRKNAKKDVGSTRFHGSSSYITPFLLLFYFKFRPSTYFTSIENFICFFFKRCRQWDDDDE